MEIRVTLLLIPTLEGVRKHPLWYNKNMGKYIDREHNKKGMPTEYRNRIDLDTALRERGMDGLYGRSEKSKEQKELHAFVIKRGHEKGEKWVKERHIKGKLFNKKDSKKI